MKLTRHTRWHWITLGTIRGNAIPNVAFVMDDYGYLQPVTYRTSRISLRSGDA